MLKYAPTSEQPPLGRSADELSEAERILFEKFIDPTFIDVAMTFLTLEENKGKDRFHAKFFVLFKVQFDAAILIRVLSQLAHPM